MSWNANKTVVFNSQGTFNLEIFRLLVRRFFFYCWKHSCFCKTRNTIPATTATSTATTIKSLSFLIKKSTTNMTKKCFWLHWFIPTNEFTIYRNIAECKHTCTMINHSFILKNCVLNLQSAVFTFQWRHLIRWKVLILRAESKERKKSKKMFWFSIDANPMQFFFLSKNSFWKRSNLNSFGRFEWKKKS